MSEVSIGPAQAGDDFALAAILSDWIDETPWMPRLHTREDDRAFVADLIHSGGVLSLREDGRPVGFLFESGGHIGAFYLAPEVRRRGLGRRLLDLLKTEYPRLDLWTFAANAEARRFYLREGFVEVERTAGDNDEGLTDIRLVWRKEKADG